MNYGQKVIDLVKADLPYWTHVSAVVLPLRPMNLDSWILDMENPLQACDELFLFMLNRLHLRHTVVYTKTRPWSTICTCESMSDDQLYAKSDLLLVYLGQDVYGELKEKPVLYKQPNVQAMSIQEENVSSTPEGTSPQQSLNNIISITDEPAVDRDNDNLEMDEKSKQPKPSAHSLVMDKQEQSTDPCTVSTNANPVIPPLLPIVLPLRLLVVDYLKTCTSPLVNPIVGNLGNESNAINHGNTSSTPTSTPRHVETIPTMHKNPTKL